MAGPRDLAPPPTFVARNFGLLSVAQTRFDQPIDQATGLPDLHWQNGVTYQSLCGLGGSTYDDFCVTGSAPVKAANMTTPNRGATPFTPFSEIDCPPIGYTIAEIEGRVREGFLRVESWQVERAFWTGSVAATGQTTAPGSIAYPHLAANAQVLDSTLTPTIVLQTAATSVTGSTVVDIVEGVGLLEQALANCNNGQGVIRVPAILGPQGFRAGIFKVNGQHIETQTGNLVALGAGYPGTAPDGSSTPGAVWIYATGQVFAYRSPVISFRLEESMNRSTNQTKMIAERTYVLGWDCCHYAVPVSVGGIVTGIVGSPS